MVMVPRGGLARSCLVRTGHSVVMTGTREEGDESAERRTATALLGGAESGCVPGEAPATRALGPAPGGSPPAGGRPSGTTGIPVMPGMPALLQWAGSSSALSESMEVMQ